jgi:hypothetical protein
MWLTQWSVVLVIKNTCMRSFHPVAQVFYLFILSSYMHVLIYFMLGLEKVSILILSTSTQVTI